MAFWEGQTSRGQECAFSSFARSPSEYKFATLSSWRGRYPHRREFSDTAGVPGAGAATLDRMDFEFLPPRLFPLPPSTPNPDNSITNLFIATENHCRFIRRIEERTSLRYFGRLLAFPCDHISPESDFPRRQTPPCRALHASAVALPYQRVLSFSFQIHARQRRASLCYARLSSFSKVFPIIHPRKVYEEHIITEAERRIRSSNSTDVKMVNREREKGNDDKLNIVFRGVLSARDFARRSH